MTIEQANAYFASLPEGFAPARQLQEALSAKAGRVDYLGVAGERFRVEWVSAAEGARFAQVMNDFAEHIAALGENVKLRDLRCKK